MVVIIAVGLWQVFDDFWKERVSAPMLVGGLVRLEMITWQPALELWAAHADAIPNALVTQQSHE